MLLRTSRMRPRTLLLPLVLAIGSIANVARADEPLSSKADSVSAQHFFQTGREAAARGDHETACRAFEESLRLEVAVGTLFNLAHCEEQLGRLASAWQHLQEGLDRLEPTDPRHAPARASAAALEARVPRLTVRLASTSTEAHVLRDGVELSSVSLGTPLPVNPGRHTIVVRASGRAEAKVDIDLAEGEKRTVDVAPGPVVAIPVAKAPKTLRTPMWISAGTAAVAVGAGLVTGGLAMGRASVVDDHCDDANVCDEAGRDALSAGKTFGTVSTVAFVTAGVAATAAVVLWVLGRDAKTSHEASSGALVRF